MQKDFHFNVTYALARRVGLSPQIAEKIAWANQYTDENTQPDLHGIQTQVKIAGGNWADKQIQATVLVPFHFIPGDGWKVTPNSELAREAVQDAMDEPIRFGIALHAFQDTFSHEGFTGWEEPSNGRFGFNHLWAGITPNIGHADFGPVPDIIYGKGVDNRAKALNCARQTLTALQCFAKSSEGDIVGLERIFSIADYDERKQKLIDLEIPARRFSSCKQYKDDFIKAARKHLAFILCNFS